MEGILEEIRATYDCGIWYPVVASTLMLPDACGAIEYWGQTKRPRDRYIDWYDQWVTPSFSPSNTKFDGSVVYIVRNALMHETTGFTRGCHGFDRIIFVPPNKSGVTLEFNLLSSARIEEIAFQVTIEGFMNAVEHGVREWLKEVGLDQDRRRATALENIIQYRPHGHSPFISGVPVVS